jgi:competence protein ComEC
MLLTFSLAKYKFLLVLVFLIFLRIAIFGVGDRAPQVKLHWFEDVRNKIYERYMEILPSPHSELLAGMVLGLDQLYNVPTFNDILLETGTIHVVVVSGFNIVIFFDFLQRIVGSMYRLKNLLIAECISFIYAVFTGFDYPVIRAWVLCTILYMAKYIGINVSSLYLLLLTGCAMLIPNPLALFDMSFQLSFLAVTGLILFTNPLKKAINQVFRLTTDRFFVNDLLSSVSAQVLVWPLISYKIGTVNLFSPISNALLLWCIPYATAIGLAIALLFSSQLVSFGLSLLVYPFLDYFIEGAVFFSKNFNRMLQI